MEFAFTHGHDAYAFLAQVKDFLVRREAENNLVLGILAGIIDGRQTFSDEPPLMLAVENATGIQLVALRTPPHNLLLSTAENDGAIKELARELYDAGHRLPGVNASSREANVFAEAWSDISGATARLAESQRIYSLERLNPPRPVRGELRRCDGRDLALATEWMNAFVRDIGEPQVSTDARRWIGARNAGLFFWIDGSPVAMAGFSGPTPHGIRIGMVYTPPKMRRRGYASVCVAALSQRMLDEGRKFCFLYTDLANPTSNHIYQEIGYRPVCDSAMLMFES